MTDRPGDTIGEGDRELIEKAKALNEECRMGVEERGVMPAYVDACVTLKSLAPKLLTLCQSLLSDRDKLTEDYLFAKRQWHQESERAERLENELAPIRKLRDDPNWEVVRAALIQTEVP